MSDLNKLLQIKGVFAAGSFDDNGNLTGYAGDIAEVKAAQPDLTDAEAQRLAEARG